MSRLWRLRPAIEADVDWLAELRAEALQANLVRLGRFDEVMVRQRFRTKFVPAYTSVIVVDEVDAGCVALRPDGTELWLEHFYLPIRLQGRGIGGEVLGWAIGQAAGRVLRLSVLDGSRARELYERHGFVVDALDDVDLFMSRR